MPIDFAAGGNGRRPGLLLGNGNGNMFDPSMPVVDQAQRNQYNPQLSGVGGGQVKSGQNVLDSKGNIISPLVNQLGSGGISLPKPPNGGGRSGVQNVLDFTGGLLQPPPPKNPIFGPPRELMSPKGGTGNTNPSGDYQYQEDLPPRPMSKNQKPNYTAPLLGEKKII